MVRLRLVLAVLCLWLSSAAPSQADTITVFAAASLKNALDEVGRSYEARTGDKVRMSYGASSAIARQIEQGAPADLFISADRDWMDYLERQRLIAPANSKVALRVGKGMPLARALGTGRLAMAGPDVPAGKYAKAALSALGAWPSVSGRLVQAENVRAALQYVARGEAPLGVVYDTDALAEPRVRIVGLFPEATHPRIVYPAALTADADVSGGSAFLAYLSGPEAVRIFRRHGFRTLARN